MTAKPLNFSNQLMKGLKITVVFLKNNQHPLENDRVESLSPAFLLPHGGVVGWRGASALTVLENRSSTRLKFQLEPCKKAEGLFHVDVFKKKKPLTRRYIWVSE